MTHKHCITHIEISAKDIESAAKFYQDVFEWKVQKYPEMNYTTFSAEGGTGGGFCPVSEGNPAGTVLIYINTPDLKESLAKVRAHGGTVLEEELKIPTVGTMATFRDPSGNLIALLEPEGEM